MKKPFTFWEYLFCRSKNVIETKDGRCYMINKPTWYMSCQIAYIILCLPVLICPIYYVFGSYWPNVIFDYLFMLMAIPFVISVIRYRNTLSAPAVHCTVDRNKPNRCVKIAAACFVLLLSLFFLLNGVGVSSLRSLIEGQGRVMSVELNFDAPNGERQHVTLYFDDGSGVLTAEPFPDISGSQRNTLSVSTIQTPALIRLTLNGVPQESGVHLDIYPHWFWDDEYFLRYYDMYVSPVDLKDGSVLTLTCGSLTREWVFDVADEEAS